MEFWIEFPHLNTNQILHSTWPQPSSSRPQANSKQYLPDHLNHCNYPNHPKQTNPNQTKPNQTKSNQTKPNLTKPNQTKLNQTKPTKPKKNQNKPNKTLKTKLNPSKTEPYQKKLNPNYSYFSSFLEQAQRF